MPVRSPRAISWAAILAATVLSVGTGAFTRADVVRSIDAGNYNDGDDLTAAASTWATLKAVYVSGSGDTTLPNSTVVADRSAYAYNIQFGPTDFAADSHWGRSDPVVYFEADFATPAGSVSLDSFGTGARLDAFDADGNLLGSDSIPGGFGASLSFGDASGPFNIAFVRAYHEVLPGADFAGFNNLTATFEGAASAVPTPAAAPAALGLLGLAAAARTLKSRRLARR